MDESFHHVRFRWHRIRNQAWEPRRLRLNDYAAQAFPLRGKDEKVHCPHQRRDMPLEAGECEAVLKVTRRNLLLDLFTICTVTHEQKVHIRERGAKLVSHID